MSKLIDNLYELNNSPFLLEKYFIFAYQGFPVQKNNILLAYLVLPVIFSESSVKFLKNANKKSSLLTFRKDKEKLAGLPEQIRYYKKITNLCLQHLIENSDLIIDEDFILSINPQKIYPAPLTDQEISAKKMGAIFSDTPIQTVYRLLGVKSL